MFLVNIEVETPITAGNANGVCRSYSAATASACARINGPTTRKSDEISGSFPAQFGENADPSGTVGVQTMAIPQQPVATRDSCVITAVAESPRRW